jgi:hypothetical protein
VKDVFKNNTVFGLLSLSVTVIICIISGNDFLKMHEAPPLYPSAALTKTEMLSDYNPNLKDTRGDSKIYYFESENPGGKSLILGGTHPNEPAGFLAASLILENVNVSKGTLLVIPRANNSAFTHNDPMEGQPQFYSLNGKKGERIFRFGSRITNPIDQWPDPEIYLHYPSKQKLAGNETRNINRSYPGKEDGNITEQMAYAILKLIKSQKIDIAFDLHEAAPEYPVVNAVVATERSQDIASEAAMMLQFEGLIYSLEPSPYNFHGLSHREWQDYTDTFPILLETANPIQGRLRGKSDVNLILTGKDKMYLQGSALGELHVPYDEDGISINVRVGRHIAAVKKIIEIFSEEYPEKTIVLENLPEYEELQNTGIESYF